MPVASRSSIPEQKPNSISQNRNIVILAGGVGGAKLADGVAQIMPPENVTVIVNSGDDFQHLGLTICPDMDTVMYALAGVENPETGWGRAGETWRIMAEIGRLGGPEWFKLGDLDLATHLVRSQLLAEGHSLTRVTQKLCSDFGIEISVLPMSDQPAPTMMNTDHGLMPFQTWFVEQKWQPAVREVLLPDVISTAQVVSCLENADLILIAPSNPFVSIDPILNAYPVRSMLADLAELVVAVSPIIAGEAVKGPAAKMMAELGMSVSSAAIAQYYGDFIDVFVFDRQDNALFKQEGSLNSLVTFQTDTFMKDRQDRSRLAQEILNFSMELLSS
jgi:LPPG:FO 2-phospho-L-lactate transferase